MGIWNSLLQRTRPSPKPTQSRPSDPTTKPIKKDDAWEDFVANLENKSSGYSQSQRRISKQASSTGRKRSPPLRKSEDSLITEIAWVVGIFLRVLVFVVKMFWKMLCWVWKNLDSDSARLAPASPDSLQVKSGGIESKQSGKLYDSPNSRGLINRVTSTVVSTIRICLVVIVGVVGSFMLLFVVSPFNRNGMDPIQSSSSTFTQSSSISRQDSRRATIQDGSARSSTINSPTKGEVRVKAYTRQDGTRVDSHTRSRPNRN